MAVKIFVRGSAVQSGVNEEGDEWGKITFEARGLNHNLQRVTCFASDAEALLKDLRDEGPKSIIVEDAEISYDEFTGSDDEQHHGAKIAPAILLDALEE
jgi:phenolic acid decarboxylase